MSEPQSILLQIDPYRLKWNQDCYEPPKSYDPRNAGDGDILGNFWAVGRPILNYNSADKVYVDYGHPFINNHPIIKKYWATAKEAQGSEEDNEVLITADRKARLHKAADAEPIENKFSEHISALDKMITKYQKDAPPDFFKIHIYCLDSKLGDFLLETIKEDSQKQDLLLKLRIKLVLEKSPDFLNRIVQADPRPAVLAVGSNDISDGSENNKFFERHLVFRLKQDGSNKIYVTEERDEKEGNSPSFWFLKDKNELSELIWLYIDFYYLRWRYMVLWEYCLSNNLHFDCLADAENFIRIGITASIVLIDEKECDSSVMVKENLRVVWHNIIADLESVRNDEISLKISCDGHHPLETPFKNGGTAEFPISVDDLGKRLTVEFNICNDSEENTIPRIFVLHRDGILSRYNNWQTNVSVEDDGGAADVEIICKGRHERRNGKWVVPSAENVHLEYTVTSPRNGRWQADKDPVTFKINGLTQKSPYLLPDNVGVFQAEATTKSGKSASLILYRLPRTDAIFLDIGHLSSGDTICTVQREKKTSGLCSKGDSNKKGRRLKSIRCAQEEEFIIETYGVLNKDHSAEVWASGCDLRFYDTASNQTTNENAACLSSVNGNINLHVKNAGNFTLRITSRDIPSVFYDVEFSVFANRSKFALIALGCSFMLSLTTTLCWFGLNLFTFLVYLLCPATLYYIATHQEGCLRKNWHKIIFYLAMAGTALIISKALWEELR